MANMGLLGALSGFGQGLVAVGKDIAQRRQEALEDAKRMAMYERQRADKKADDERNFEQQVTIETGRQDRLDARETARLQAREKEKATDRDFRLKEKEADRSHQTELARLRAQLARDNSEAGIRLRDELKQDDIRGITYGEPVTSGRWKGFSQVIRIDKQGVHHNTNQYVRRPGKNGMGFDEEEDGDEDELSL